jgi:tyrosyl-tRNA synthetase
MAGRQLMQRLGIKPQIVIAMGESLPGTDGVMKMSKSKGNHIPILSEAGQMYTDIMKLPDSTMSVYHRLMLGWPQSKVDELIQAVERGEKHPQEIKADLALEITSIFHGQEAALAGREFSLTAMREGGIPENIPQHIMNADTPLVDMLVQTGLCKSKNDAKRQIEGGGVRRNGEKVTDRDEIITLDQLPVVLQYGKRNFVRLIPE